MPRTLTIYFPDGRREYRFTDQVFEPGDLLQREAGSWFVESVGGLNEKAKHTAVVVRPGGRTAKALSWG